MKYSFGIRRCRGLGLVASVFALVTASSGCGDPALDEDLAQVSSKLSGGLVIAEVYGGAAASSATYSSDYVVLFNRGAAPASLSGLAIRYASSSNKFSKGAAVRAALPNATVTPGGYYLIRMSRTYGNGAAVVGVDFAAPHSIEMSAKNGKVALTVADDAFTDCGDNAKPCDPSTIIDLVGYGTANYAENTPTPELSNTKAAKRKDGGCVETDNNRQDFEVLAPSAPVPNSSTLKHTCAPGPEAGPDTAPDVPTPPDPIAPGLVLAEIYGAGGTTDALFKNDYVVLFNRGNEVIALKDVVLQYAQKGNKFLNRPNQTLALPDASIKPGAYFLIQLASKNVLVGADLPKPDHTGSLDLGSKNGKVALVMRDKVLENCGANGVSCDLSQTIDMVGYGDVEISEGNAVVPRLDNKKSGQRKRHGCIDTNVNGDDFVVEAPSTPIRSSATAVVDCSADPDTGAGGSGGMGGSSGEGGGAGQAGQGGGAGQAGQGGDAGQAGQGGGGQPAAGGHPSGSDAGPEGSNAVPPVLQTNDGCGCSLPGRAPTTAASWSLLAVIAGLLLGHRPTRAARR